MSITCVSHLSSSTKCLIRLFHRDVANLGKLKHPGIVAVVEPFEETRSQASPSPLALPPACWAPEGAACHLWDAYDMYMNRSLENQFNDDQTLTPDLARQMIMVTEQVFASLTNVLSNFEGLPAEVQTINEGLQMSDLERKHGLLQARTWPPAPAMARKLFSSKFEHDNRKAGQQSASNQLAAEGMHLV